MRKKIKKTENEKKGKEKKILFVYLAFFFSIFSNLLTTKTAR